MVEFFIRMRAEAYGISDVGLQREHNEDSFAVLADYREKKGGPKDGGRKK